MCWKSAARCRYCNRVFARRLSVALLLLLSSLQARAADCFGTTTLAGCFSVLGVTGPAEPSPFRTLSLGRTLPAESFALSANSWYIIRPAELVASSPDPAGRTIDVVSRATVIDLRAAAGVGRRLDLTLALPVFVDIRGAGNDAIATQKPAPFQGAALGDPRVGLRTSLLPASIRDWRLMLRNEWTLPLGNNTHYAGDLAVTSTFAATGVRHYQGWSAALDLGLLSAPAVRFGDVRLGTSAIFGLGFARDIITNNILSIGLEAWAKPVLVAPPTKDSPSSNISRVVPAEWLLNVQWHPESQPCWFWLGGGGALPLSQRETTDALRVDTSFIAPSTARIRLGLGLGLILDAAPAH